MAKQKALIAAMDTFTKAGRFVPKGNPVPADEVDFEGDDSPNLIEAPKALSDGPIAVEVSAIAPTGPNPVNPQQIAPDVIQTEAGYFQNGVRLVGEVTQPEKQRIKVVGLDNDGDETQAEITQLVDEADTRSAERDAELRALSPDEREREAERASADRSKAASSRSTAKGGKSKS